MRALIIKKEWLDLIFQGVKTWEIRGSNTRIREKIELIQSGSGLVVGTCEIIDSIKLSIDDFKNNVNKHYNGIDGDLLPYKNTHAWVLRNVKRYVDPRPYKHPNGAIIWVNLD